MNMDNINEIKRALVKAHEDNDFLDHVNYDIKTENAKLKEIIKRLRLDDCKRVYDNDLDRCSTREREGCGSCAYLNNFSSAYLTDLSTKL